MVRFVAGLMEELAKQEQRLGWRQQHTIEALTEVIRKLQSQLKRVKEQLARRSVSVAALSRACARTTDRTCSVRRGGQGSHATGDAP